jgi:hypothetical protein
MDIEMKGFTDHREYRRSGKHLAGGQAERKFQVPNPFYFTP